MLKVILVATEKPFAKAAVDRMKEVVSKNPDFELRLLENYTDKQDLLDVVKDVDGLIIRSDKATREVLEAALNLKVVVRGGAGYDNIDCEAATEKGICVMNTPGQNSNAVSELVFGIMLNLVRHQYVGKPGTELRGKSIGIHAYGNPENAWRGWARGSAWMFMPTTLMWIRALWKMMGLNRWTQGKNSIPPVILSAFIFRGMQKPSTPLISNCFPK